MNMHSDPDDFPTRYRNLDERAETIDRRLRSVSRRLRCTGEVDWDAYAVLRAEADALVDETVAFLAVTAAENA